LILVVYSETAVLAPLETLNTNLNYQILDNFVGKMTDSTSKFLLNNTSSNINIIPSNAIPDGLLLIFTNNNNVNILLFSINQ
jgi:hypothetical protein